MTDNKVKLKVKLNDDKTEIMIISPSRMSTSLSTQDSFATCNTPVPLLHWYLLSSFHVLSTVQ